jgi:LysR family cys regulon transcriptional activator
MANKIDQNFIYKKNRLQQIKGFYYTARSRSISAAANIMNLTQSTVTLQIQSLERDLGLKLINRDTKPITLTKHGEEFYEMACPLMHEFESILEKFFNNQKNTQKKEINIAIHHIALSYLMPEVVSKFKKTHPDVVIIFRNIPPNEAIKRLKDDEIDLAFYPNLQKDSDIDFAECSSYDPVLILNKNNPLAKNNIKNLKDLNQFDLIRIDHNLITLPLFEEAVRTHGIKGSIEFENGNWEILKHFVANGNFAAVVSTICVDKNDKNLVTKNLSKFFPAMDYRIAYQKGRILNPLIIDFINLLKK